MRRTAAWVLRWRNRRCLFSDRFDSRPRPDRDPVWMNVSLSSKDGYLSLFLCDFFLYPQRSPAGLGARSHRDQAIVQHRRTCSAVRCRQAYVSNNGDVPQHRDAREFSRQRYSDNHGMRAQTLDR